MGSSPRVWGQEHDVSGLYTVVGIIPTRMGTSCRRFTYRPYCRDHPHAYGDKKKTLSDDSLTVGSSPRVWGQEFCGRIKVADKGIIPTRMGTSEELAPDIANRKDHPHAYGDKTAHWYLRLFCSGSSPRVWGQGKMNGIKNLILRIIPTRMGTSYEIDRNLLTVKGSSPRVWGQVFIATE